MALNDILTSMDGARDALVTAINAKGGSLADNATFYQCADAVGSLSGGTSAEYYKCASVSAEAATPEGATFTMQLTLKALSITSTYHWVMDDTSKTGTERTWTGTVKGDSGTHTLHFNGTYWQVVDGLGNTTATETADDPWDITNWHNADGGDVSCTFSDVSSASTGSKTWSGYKAVFDSGAGTWSFESDVTEGLAYTSVTPIVGGIYSADALVTVSMLYDGTVTLPGCVFYAELKDATVSLKSGQTLTIPDSAVFQNVAGVPCVQTNGTDQITFTPENLPSGNVPRTYCFWNYMTATPSGGTFFASKPSSYINMAYYSIEYYNSGYTFTFGGNCPFSNVTVPLNQWAFVALTYDGKGTCYLYVNKTKHNPSFHIDTSLDTRLDINLIGGISGCYAKARIFDYALSETEIGYMVDNKL